MTSTERTSAAGTLPATTAPPRSGSPATTTAPARRRPRRPTTAGGVAVAAVFVVAIVYFFIPFWWLLIASTKTTQGLFTSPALWIDSTVVFVENLARTFTHDNGIYLTWVQNTLFYALASGVGATVLAVAGGYAFAKFRFPGKKAAFSILLGAVMIPNTVLVLPTYMIMSTVGLVDTAWAVILPSLLNPLGVYLIRIYAQDSVPTEVMEQARIDGAGEFRIFAQVALPMLRPAVATVLLFSIVATWNNFFLPLVMLSSNEKYPLTVGLTNWRALLTVDGGAAQDLYPLIIMGSLVAVIPLVVTFLIMQRQWQSGLALGSVKS